MTTSKKIGRLIREIRQQRGLTQTQLAKMTKSPVSYISRLESGAKNLSMSMLARLSDALQRPLVNFSDHKISFRVHGGRKLKGEITLNKAKNSVVGLMMAALLNHGRTTIQNCPRIEEVFRLIEVFESLEIKVRWNQDNLEIKRPPKLNLKNINHEAALRTRSVIMLIGPVATERSNFRLPFAGGCQLGKRSIIAHQYALEEIGVQITTASDHYLVKSNLTPSKDPVVMYESGDTATENMIMASAKIAQETTIKMASANYQVQDVCLFLQSLGVKVEGIGTTTLKICGIDRKINQEIVYQPTEDPVEAMTFIGAAVATNSEITIKRVPLDFLEIEILKLRKMGLKIKVLKEYLADNQQTRLGDILIPEHNGQLQALLDKISARPFPGLNIDHLPYFVPIAACLQGQTLIHDWVYENRAIYYTELNRLGVDIQLADPHRVYVRGPTTWRPTDLSCPPALRPATINLIGMLAAPGESILRNTYTINRGYENIAQSLNSLGAKIETVRDF